MWSLLTRTVMRNTVIRAVVRTAGAAALGGFGWKLGADAYEGFKRRLGRKPKAPETASDD